MKKCAKCGRDNLDDMRLCGYCGTRFPEEKTCGTFKKTLLTFYLLPEEVAVRETEKPKPVSDENFEIAVEKGETVSGVENNSVHASNDNWAFDEGW